ncbi:MAG: hypothetical protein HY869_04120 [Chloroflexi bacterium]|nr:hypothetical protein [Chloroflexota bacterium]
MSLQSNARKAAPMALAFVLWLAAIGLGMEAIYTSKEIFYLVFVQLGGAIEAAARLVLLFVFFLGVVFLVFVIGMTEYHRKWVGQIQSWRLFGWSLTVELSILILYYLL